jgi:hypothetical protein
VDAERVNPEEPGPDLGDVPFGIRARLGVRDAKVRALRARGGQ